MISSAPNVFQNSDGWGIERSHVCLSGKALLPSTGLYLHVVTRRRFAIGLALLLLGFLIAVVWNHPPPMARAQRRLVKGSDLEESIAARDPDHDVVAPVVLSRTATKPSATVANSETLGPDPRGHQAKIEIDFWGIPQEAWSSCHAIVEGSGPDAYRTRRGEQPREGRVTFTVPAGRWRVFWSTSFQLSDEHGRIMHLKPDDHVVVRAATDQGDPPEKWIWPGLGMIEIVVFTPTGKPVVHAAMVLCAPRLLRAATDHRGRCRFEVRPGRYKLLVGLQRLEVAAERGKVTRKRVGGRMAGSLVVHSAKPRFSRIRRMGTSEWQGPSLADEIRGIISSGDNMRFDLVPPGEYEVAIGCGAETVGAVTVLAGVETHFDVKR